MTTTSDEEEETMLDSEEEEGEEEDSDEEYELSQRDKNLVRERNVRALRDGTVKIAYASVLSNLKPPEPNEVILKRHFQPLVPGGALQTGKRSLVECVDVFFVIFVRFRTISFSSEGEGKKRFWVLTFEKKNSPSVSLFPRIPDVLFLASILTLSFSLSFFLSSGMQRRCNARFSPEKYSSRLARRNDRNCRKSYRPARTQKISRSRKVFQSWCCGKTRIRKGRRRISCYLR